MDAPREAAYEGLGQAVNLSLTLWLFGLDDGNRGNGTGQCMANQPMARRIAVTALCFLRSYRLCAELARKCSTTAVVT